MQIHNLSETNILWQSQDHYLLRDAASSRESFFFFHPLVFPLNCNCVFKSPSSFLCPFFSFMSLSVAFAWSLTSLQPLFSWLFSPFLLSSWLQALSSGKPSLTFEALFPFPGLFWSVLFGNLAGPVLMSSEHLHNVLKCIKQCDLVPVVCWSFSYFFAIWQHMYVKKGKKGKKSSLE